LAGTLSGGERRMLNIGVALMSDPTMLIIDELSLGLMPKIVTELFNALKKVNEEKGISIFLVEQYVKKALEFSSRGYLMEKGKIVLDGDSNKMLYHPYIQEAYI